MNASVVVSDLKEFNEDFEWYPSTDAIIDAVISDYLDAGCHSGNHHWRRSSSLSVLDIGAGDGRVLARFRERFGDGAQLFAIEKSTAHVSRLVQSDVIVVGNDFFSDSLLGKDYDVIFCNPPFSELGDWLAKIIRECSAPCVYVVAPLRWRNDEKVKEAIRFRGFKSFFETEGEDCEYNRFSIPSRVVSLGMFDFSCGNRPAKVSAELVRLDLEGEEDALFERFFNEEFYDLCEKFNEPESEDATPNVGEMKSVVKGNNLIERLVESYNIEYSKIVDAFHAIAKIETWILKECCITPKMLCETLRTKLFRLKERYWMSIFENLDSLTSRLTSSTRRKMLSRIAAAKDIAFTASNVYNIVIWALNNANRYYDSQLIDVYEMLAGSINRYGYVSNKRTWVNQEWRYCKDGKGARNKLDYRFVSSFYSTYSATPWRVTLADDVEDFLNDLITVVNNLGFMSTMRIGENGILPKPGEEVEVLATWRGQRDVAFAFRVFKNGNVHFRFHKEVIFALNSEYGRLKGWLNSPEEAANELGDVLAAEYFGVNFQAGVNTVLMLPEESEESAGENIV